MRTLVWMLCGLALSVAFGSPVTADDIDHKKLISDFITPQMPDQRRAEIIEELALVSPDDMASQLKKAIAEEAKRTHALRLAIEFQVTGLWSTAQEFYESPEQEQIIHYGLSLLDRGAEKFLIERWQNAPVDSDEFRNLQRAFQLFGVDPKLLVEFKKALDDESSERERADAAYDVLRFQAGSSVWDRSEFIAGWSDLYKEVKNHGKAQKLKGRDLLRRAPWVRSGARQWGYAMRFDEGGQASCESCAPPGFNLAPFSVTVSVWLEGEDAVFFGALRDSNGANYEVTISKSACTVKTAEDEVKFGTPVMGKWMELKWSTVMAKRGEDWDFEVRLSLNGKEAPSGLVHAGKPSHLVLGCKGGGVLVGAADYLRD